MGISAFNRILAITGNGKRTAERERDTRETRSVAKSWAQPMLAAEQTFLHMLSIERRRSERSRKPFILMLLNLSKCNGDAVAHAVTAVSGSTRDTDVMGWYKDGIIIGVIFTEIGETAKETVLETVRGKVTKAIRRRLSEGEFSEIELCFYLFPEKWESQKRGHRETVALYPEVAKKQDSARSALAIKRVIDALGGVCALILLSPVFLAIAAAIKLTSKGPVFFRQERVGHFGNSFFCYKFRTMHVDNDPQIHQEYVKRLIQENAAATSNGNGDQAVFKITNDPRVTRVGRFLRRTSMDEFPQFLNVLKGDMSLVGPRPPIPYELEEYDIWHRRRVLEAKPGITGLWQVSGRSRTGFDEMVRLDLRYVRSWSLWLDLKILLLTPRAVFSGDGAY